MGVIDPPGYIAEVTGSLIKEGFAHQKNQKQIKVQKNKSALVIKG